MVQTDFLLLLGTFLSREMNSKILNKIKLSFIQKLVVIDHFFLPVLFPSGQTFGAISLIKSSIKITLVYSFSGSGLKYV
jgi:hypothetical protein